MWHVRLHGPDLDGLGLILSLVPNLILPPSRHRQFRRLCCQRGDAGPVAAGDHLRRRHPGAADADRVGQAEILLRVAGRHAAGGAEGDLWQGRGQRFQRGDSADGLGREEFLEAVAAFQ